MQSHPRLQRYKVDRCMQEERSHPIRYQVTSKSIRQSNQTCPSKKDIEKGPYVDIREIIRLWVRLQTFTGENLSKCAISRQVHRKRRIFSIPILGDIWIKETDHAERSLLFRYQVSSEWRKQIMQRGLTFTARTQTRIMSCSILYAWLKTANRTSESCTADQRSRF